MDKIAFQSYLDCVYGGVQQRYFSNVVEIEVERQPKPVVVRKSIKIPREGDGGEMCQCRVRRTGEDLLVLAIMLFCEKLHR